MSNENIRSLARWSICEAEETEDDKKAHLTATTTAVQLSSALRGWGDYLEQLAEKSPAYVYDRLQVVIESLERETEKAKKLRSVLGKALKLETAA